MSSARMFEPSRGGMGMRLKIIKIKLINTISDRSDDRLAEAKGWRKRSAKPKIIARVKFASGPARALIKLPMRGFLKLLGLMRTGLPQPKPSVSKKIVPSGSRWASGLSVTRPSSSAVLSPSFRETKACAAS